MIESTTEKVNKFLQSPTAGFAPILEIPLTDENIAVMDLSQNSNIFNDIDLTDVELFSSLVFNYIESKGAKVGAGGYLENRAIYNKSDNFDGPERRTFHLGIDLWVKPETIVYAPLGGTIHSFRNNEGFGNYGPTIILEHQVENLSFYTLYGHLSEKSLIGLRKNDEVKSGTMIGKIGNEQVNGGWPPHLHFQIITDLEGNEGDFPGVAAPSDIEKYKKLCPDPNHILRVEKLDNEKN